MRRPSDSPLIPIFMMTALLATACSSLATSPGWVGGTMASTSPARIAETETRERREREAVASQPKVIGAKHILIMHAESASKPETVTRSKAEGMKRAQMVLAKVRAGAKFEDLAKEFSDEPGASERGGDLGVFDRATMVPSFGNAAFALPVGGVSEIVETKFGFHIIKRTE